MLDFVIPNFNTIVKSGGYDRMPEELRNRLIHEIANEDAFVGIARKVKANK